VQWGHQLLMLAGLYVCLLGLLLVAARRLPTRGALLEKAHLADQPLLMKLPRNITELREVRGPRHPLTCSTGGT
jgi:hypothetical protein